MTALLHDLRQPLTAIRALASVPDSPPGETGPPADLTDRLRRIGELGDWMSDLLQVGPERITVEPAVADVVDAVQDVVLAAAVSFDGRLCWRPAGVVQVPVEPAELRRAISNVVDNAVRAAGPGGRVTVRVSQIHQRACVEVDDSGPGLGAVRAQTGHGLQVTRAVLHRAGGSLVITSRRGGGVRVRMVFPLAAPDRSK
ncbi:MAG TPA: HAMP domain-containing sensor histidine kinase [Mycobacteriales bacterium]